MNGVMIPTHAPQARFHSHTRQGLSLALCRKGMLSIHEGSTLQQPKRGEARAARDARGRPSYGSPGPSQGVSVRLNFRPPRLQHFGGPSRCRGR